MMMKKMLIRFVKKVLWFVVGLDMYLTTGYKVKKEV